MEKIQPSQVKGWGVDANPENDPTYPIKKRNNGERRSHSWERPPQQQANVEVLHSNERPNLSAVFGTSTPPAGWSGNLRRFAFKFNESNYGHWLPLMLADRIAVVEGVIEDLKSGRMPNVFAEWGWAAEWRYNRASLLARILISAAVICAAFRRLTHRKR